MKYVFFNGEIGNDHYDAVFIVEEKGRFYIFGDISFIDNLCQQSSIKTAPRSISFGV
jgi:hypothetical protein